MKTSPENLLKVNSLSLDDYGRPNGILLIDKPAGVSSHDMVYAARRALEYKKIGHAGALDVFASGLLLILVGKATKLSNDFLTRDKAYRARVVFGIKTETQDPEGKVLKIDTQLQLDREKVESVLSGFAGGYGQFVSIFSSVKVEGHKLRQILRDPRWEYEVKDGDGLRTLHFKNKADPTNLHTLNVPQRDIKIYEIKLEDFGKLPASALPFKVLPEPAAEFFYADIYVQCSKGTYIRQLAEDIGEKAGTVAALATLRRVQIGDWLEDQALKPEDMAKYKPQYSK